MSANELPTIRQITGDFTFSLPLVPFLASWGEEYRAPRSDAGHLSVGLETALNSEGKRGSELGEEKESRFSSIQAQNCPNGPLTAS